MNEKIAQKPKPELERDEKPLTKGKIDLNLIKGLERKHRENLPAKRYEIRDTELKGFTLRVEKSGKLSYYMVCARAERKFIGTADRMEPRTARSIAETHRGQQAKAKAGYGETPKQEERRLKAERIQKDEEERRAKEKQETKAKSVYLTFIEEIYHPYLKGHLRNGVNNADNVRETMGNLRNLFKEFHHLTLEEITLEQIDEWKQRRQAEGRKPATINRQLNDLRACLNKAVERGYIASCPKVKRYKTDDDARCRYLTKEENQSLRAALTARDKAIKDGRHSGNGWRKDRGRKPMADLSARTFADHLEPAVLLSLNTGLREGALFSLKWADINFEQRYLTAAGYFAKSGKTQRIPLNAEALEILKQWKSQPGIKSQWVFPGKDGSPIKNAETAWKGVLRDSQITDFHWHDLRHTFASNLVMAGVEIYTVSQLLGHSDVKLTMKYAHLAPNHKQEAVEKLVSVKAAM